MIIKMNSKDISDILLSYKRSGSMNRIVGNAPTQALKLSLDNSNGLFDYKTVNDAVFEVQPTPKSNKCFFKVYEMPETWDSILELTLYDCMYIFDANYDTKIEYPATIEAQLIEMQSITGIEIDYSSVDQTILTRKTNQYDSTLTMRSYLRWIGEISGCNVMAGHDQYNKATFVPFQSTVFAEYNDLLDYKKGNPYIISKVSFNDGIRIFDKGTEDANTYFLSSDNIYITDQEHINIVSQKLIGLSVNSASNVNADYHDNLTLGNVVKCLDEFSFIVLKFEEKYAGGDEPDYILSGELVTKNQETVGVRVSNSAKIRRLQVITNDQDLSLSILAKQQDELGSQQAEFKISLDEIKETVKKTDENVEMIFKDFNVYLETNITASQIYDSNANTYIPDFFTNNLVIAANAYGIDGNEIQNVKYEWKRKTENGLEPLEAGEHVNNNTLTINHNFDESVTFVCTATLDLISKKEELTVISTKTGKDGQDGKVGPQGPQGIQGPKGTDGKQYYTWLKYADTPTTGMSDDPTGKSYIGLAYNKTTPTESTNAGDYTWSLIKGDKGDKGDAGKGIKSTAITYQAGTSGTTTPTGTWAATIPTVAQGQYLWSKTVITYTDNTTSTTYSVAYIPKNGTNGTNGATGATGTGVNTIVQQYYLSTSKTTQSGGSWVAAMPTWSTGLYLWTRFQINYKNPVSTVYTTPVCDSSWEAVNEIQVGAKNLLLNSDEVVTNASYPIKQYKMSEKMAANETYTCRLWGTLGAGKSYFGLWLDGGNISLGSLVNKGDGIFELTFKGKAGTLDTSVLHVYPVASNISVNSTITKIKLEKGNKATDWTPAPEDIDEKFDEVADDLATQLSNAKAEFSSEIVKTADSIKQEVSTTYYTKKDGEKLAERATKLEQDSQSWTFNFESLTKQLAGLDKEQKENYARILKYIRFENGNIILGESGNALTLTIQNDKIVFKQSDKELAYFTNGKLYVTDGEFTQSLRIGNYAFVPRSNGSLDFKKVG